MTNPSTYDLFLASKQRVDPPTGLDHEVELGAHLFDFQRDIARWALRRGRAAIFADCGLGKTVMQLEWAKHVPGSTLIAAPLAVAEQTVAEGERFGIPVHYCRSQDTAKPGICITNYEMLEAFDLDRWSGLVLDESSIIKNRDGHYRSALIALSRNIPFRLACTATPAPNDHMELGNHAEFLGVMTMAEMLATFFVHDGGETQSWRLKGHAVSEFWRWVASWAVMLRKPSDLGYDDRDFELPPIRYHQVKVPIEEATPGFLFAVEAQTLQERIGARRASVPQRVAALAEIVNTSSEPWIIWCNLNAEAEACIAAIPDAREVRGSDPIERKSAEMMRFSAGDTRVLVTKPSIAGFGMNWQHCRNVAFLGLSDSWEQYYQAVRRCWRFGQKREVDVWVVTAETEGAVVQNIQRKECDAERMAEGMVAHMHDLNEASIRGAERRSDAYATDMRHGHGWTMHLGDCVDALRTMDAESVHYSIFSPPFVNLYTYTNSDRDMGNCRNYDEFARHFEFLIAELYRVLMPGRLVSFHCTNIPMKKSVDGYIGQRDFRGDLIRLFEAAGFIFHSEVCIWKDPVTAMQRTKALGLLHKQLKKDSAMSRQGIPDYLVTMRKPGENAEPVRHTNEDFPVSLWQQYASPVWMDINPSDTLQYRSAREHDDERHIAPLQLEVIRRALKIWSNPGDVVLSPFAGIGSEGYVALEQGRRFVGVELKGSYFRQAVANLAAAVTERQDSLFNEEQAAE